MGYDLTRFISDVDEEFCCGICLEVLHTPRQTPCEHMFCKECITNWLATGNNNRCPIDRLLINLSELKVPARPLLNLLNKLEMECDFGPNGCRAAVKLENLQAHLKSCQHDPKRLVEVVCDKGCSLTITRREYEVHDCVQHLLDRVSRLEEENRQLKETIAPTGIVNPPRLPASPAAMWRMTSNMRITIDQSSNYNLKSHVTYNLSVAQSKYYLTLENSSFKVKPDSGEFSFGLTYKDVDVNSSYFLDECKGKSIFVRFYSFSFLYLHYNGKWEKLPAVPPSGDGTLECGIKFPHNFDSSREANDVEVYFSSNNVFARKTIPMTRDGLYPTIRLFSGNSVTYIHNS